MSDTRYSLYSEHDDASERLRKALENSEKRIERLSDILNSKPKGSEEYNEALSNLRKISESPDPSVIYDYADEDGNDTTTTLGGGGSHLSSLAIKELKKLGLVD